MKKNEKQYNKKAEEGSREDKVKDDFRMKQEKSRCHQIIWGGHHERRLAAHLYAEVRQ